MYESAAILRSISPAEKKKMRCGADREFVKGRGRKGLDTKLDCGEGEKGDHSYACLGK